MKLSRSGFRRVALALGGALLLGLLAAGSGPTYVPLTKYSRVEIPYGTLVNKNVRIESAGGTWAQPWSVGGGEDFRPPFTVYWWNGYEPSGLNDGTILNMYQAAYDKGARPVLIHVEGQREPIHGLIVFNSAIEATFGPARQSYYLQIPEDKLRQAMSGNMSVAYEYINYRKEWQNDYGYQKQDVKWYSWILWMSRTPLVYEGGRQLGP